MSDDGKNIRVGLDFHKMEMEDIEEANRRLKDYVAQQGSPQGAVKPNAKFIDGEPANLAAATMDALEWLWWFKRYSDNRRIFSQPDSSEKLAKTIISLQEYLEPYLPEEYEQKKKEG